MRLRPQFSYNGSPLGFAIGIRPEGARCQPINSQNDVALLLQALLEARLVGEAQGNQLFVALQEVENGPGSNGNLALLQVAIELWDAAVVPVAQRAEMSDHVKAKLAMRQGPSAFFLGAIGVLRARAVRIVTLNDGQSEAADALKGGNGAAGRGGHPQGAVASGTGSADRVQGLGVRHGRALRAASLRIFLPTTNLQAWSS